jgi:ketosteroid isomerase-like protein
LLAVLVCGATSAVPSQEASDADVRSKLLAMENAWNQAAEIKDLKGLATILDDDLVFVDSDGRWMTKAGILADVMTSAPEPIVAESTLVQVHGSTAIVTGIVRISGIKNGKPLLRRERFVDTWRRKNGVWVAIASVAAPVGS